MTVIFKARVEDLDNPIARDSPMLIQPLRPSPPAPNVLPSKRFELCNILQFGNLSVWILFAVVFVHWVCPCLCPTNVLSNVKIWCLIFIYMHINSSAKKTPVKMAAMRDKEELVSLNFFLL